MAMMHHKNTFQLRMIKVPTKAPSQPGWMEVGGGFTSCVTSICKMGGIYLKGRLCKFNDSVYMA